MASKAVVDYLTKQILIENNVVTFRSLSRALSMHVNAAKNELASFQQSSKGSLASINIKSHATYLISGIAVSDEDVNMVVDGDMDDYHDDVECEESRVIIVEEEELESSKALFKRIDALHVYSLSPSPIRDAGLLCNLTPSLKSFNKDSILQFGVIIGSDVQLRDGTKLPVASTSKTKHTVQAEDTSSKLKPDDRSSTSKQILSVNQSEKPKEDQKEEKPKPQDRKQVVKKTGTLDWSRAKTKEDKQREKAIEKAQGSSSKRIEEPSNQEKEIENIVLKKEEKVSDIEGKKDESKPSRGTKRKSLPAPHSSSEDEEKRSVQIKLERPRIRKGKIISDDENDEDIPKPSRVQKEKGKMSEKLKPLKMIDDDDEDRSLKAMMDVDDDLVIRASSGRRPTASSPPISSPSHSDASDAEMNIEDTGSSKPAIMRRPKKKAPLGRNGRPKKRVMKSRQTVDSKGWMATEDYSSYESVASENDDEPPPPKSKKSVSKKSGLVADTSKSEASAKSSAVVKNESESIQKSKPSNGRKSLTESKSMGAKGGQKGLNMFFGPAKSK